MAKFNPDQYIKEKKTPSFDANAFDPDAYLKEKKSTEDGGGKPLEALAQGVGEAASLGYAPQLAAAVEQVIPNPTSSVDKDLAAKGFKIEEPKDDYLSARDAFLKRQEGLKESNPYSYGAGSLVGTLGGGVGAAGLLVKAAPALQAAKGAGLLSSIAKGAGQGAIIGGAYNPGDKEGQIDPIQFQGRSDAAKLGGVLGGAIPAIMSVPGLIKNAASLNGRGLKADIFGAPKGPLGPVAAESIVPQAGVQPTTIEEIVNKSKQGIPAVDSAILPEKKVLEDAASRIKLQNNIHPLQLNSLDSPKARDAYKVAMELPGEEGQAFRNYELNQKNELVNNHLKTIDELVPGYKPTSNATEAGNKAVQTFTEQYRKNHTALSPEFEKLSNLPITVKPKELIKNLSASVPSVQDVFDIGKNNKLIIKPYSSKSGMAKSTYNAVKEAVQSATSGKGTLSFKELSNIRKGLDQHINIQEQGQASGQIRALKSGLMDFMQESAGKNSPEIRDIYKKWAINEQNADVIQDVFGASVGKPEYSQITRVKPEDISDRIFNNTASVKAAKQMLPPDKFKELLANYLSEQTAKVVDKGHFSSNKFGSFLRKNSDVLEEAFRENPEALQKIRDINTITRILPDSPVANPSGTAKTIAGLLGEKLKKSEGAFDALRGVGEVLKDKFQEGSVLKNINNELSSGAPPAPPGMLSKSMSGVKSMMGSLGENGPATAGIMAGQASSGGFSPDPFVMLSKSPDNIKRAVENGAIPVEAVKAIVSKTGTLTREDYIRAQRVLSSAQGRQAMRSAMFHVSTIGNPEAALGPAAPVMAEQAIQGGAQNGGPRQ